MCRDGGGSACFSHAWVYRTPRVRLVRPQYRSRAHSATSEEDSVVEQLSHWEDARLVCSELLIETIVGQGP